MKTKLFLTSLILSVMFLNGCDATTELRKEDQGSLDRQKSLKVSLDEGVIMLANAVDLIANSEEFNLLARISLPQQGEGSIQYSPEFKNDSTKIMLSDVAGVYQYSWTKVKKKPYGVWRLFDKTAESDHLIVYLPVEKVRDYTRLFINRPKDSLLTNNFEINVSDYLFYRSVEKGKEYKLAADLKIDETDLGKVTIFSTHNKVNGLDYLSVYSLGSGYTVLNQENSGDTTVSVYAIQKGNQVLYEENISSYKVNAENRRRERTYSLTIGDVKIVREMGPNSLDNAKVYVGGVLQTNAKVELIINENNIIEPGFTNRKRDIKITFDDGTSTTIRDLKGDVFENVAGIFKSVRQAGFAVQIVDRIAANLYRTKK